MTTTLGAPGTQAPRDVRRAYRDLREPVARRRRSRTGRAPRPDRADRAGRLRRGRGPRRRRHRGVRRALGDAARRPADERAVARSRERHPRRPPARPRRRLFDVGPVVVLGALAIGAVFVLQGVLGAGGWIWPLAIAIVGVGLLWRQADEAQRERWVDARGRIDPVRIVLGDGGWASYARLAAGVGLDRRRHRAVHPARRLVLARPRRDPRRRARARRHRDRRRALDLPARGRAQRRARGAGAHPGAGRRRRAPARLGPADARADPEEPGRRGAAGPRAGARPAGLAVLDRVHGREHRRERAPRDGRRDRGRLRNLAVDVVAVGDCDLDEAMRPIVSAAREATTNAAKHAGVPRVDVYAEITPARGRRVRP